jgi:cobalamin biosynthesis protein CobC
MVKSASAADILSYAFSCADEPLPHGGDLSAARRLFPDAPQPFLDLSTGINPAPYPLPELPGEVFARLPDAAALGHLAAVAASTYGAPSAAHVVAAPGTQILLALVAGLLPPCRAAILSPTYGEHARVATAAGHRVGQVRDLGAAGDAALVIVTNPNNPDGRMVSRDDLLALAKDLQPRGGLLVVDEAFMDVGPDDASLAGEVSRGNIVVLRSFGKFFGLAGLRLGFALLDPALALRVSAALGPWPVSGPAVTIGTEALADAAWIERTRSLLAEASRRLDTILSRSGLEIVGGTALFRLTRTPHAAELFQHLGRAGIFVRRFADDAAFPDNKNWLRFGLPAGEPDWQRLQNAMQNAMQNAIQNAI